MVRGWEELVPTMENLPAGHLDPVFLKHKTELHQTHQQSGQLIVEASLPPSDDFVSHRHIT